MRSEIKTESSLPAETTDMLDRTNHTSISRDRATASRAETVTRPDGTQTISIYTNNLLKSVTHYSSATSALSAINYSHDPFNRIQTTTEPAANGNTRMTTMQYNPAGVVTSVTVSAGSLSQTTTYELDNMGRVVKTTLPDGGIVMRSYNYRGELVQQSGVRTYPVTYAYTDQGRMATMSTYRNGLFGSPDTTTWIYDPARGFLTAKTYADGNGISYTYNPNLTLATRHWSRGITTTYAYDPAGTLTNIAYSDTTPDITYALDRQGRQVTVAQSGTGVSPVVSHTFTYAADGQLTFESVSNAPLLGGVGGGYTLTRTYDSLGRLTNSLLSDPISNLEFRTSYSFDNAGRLSTVSDGMNTATYTYGPDGATWTNLSFGPSLNTRRTFDGLNRLTSIVSASATSVVNSFSYQYNAADQRTTNVLADGSYWVYKYDAMGQVISGKKYFSDGIAVGGAQYEYDFDTIGNRKTANGGTRSVASAYTANSLNQYESRTVSGKALVTGETETNATVSVRIGTNAPAAPANRHGDYFWRAVDVDNTSAAFFTTNLKVTAHIPSGTQSLVRSETRSATVPQTPEAFTHDADGNLTSDGLWSYTWDGENRLIAVESRSGVPAAFKKKLEFAYDHQGRRVRKQVESAYSGGLYSTTNVTTYVWDGFNIIAESRSGVPAAFTNYYTHGLDLSGTFQGAGGIGGALAMTHDTGAATNTYFYCFDGNGNVVNLVSASDGSIAASYEYSPFGQLIRSAGPMAGTNPVRWSTKHTDDDTGIVAFQLRNYNPELGRWLSRDPLGNDPSQRARDKKFRESPALVSYGMCGNNCVSRHDALGLTWADYYAVKNEVHVPKAFGITGGAAAMATLNGMGITVGFGAAAIFFPDSCEVAVFNVTAGSISSGTFVPGANGTSDSGVLGSYGVGYELAYYSGGSGSRGTANAASFQGIFHTVTVSIPGVPVSPSYYEGDISTVDPNGVWKGGTVTAGFGPGSAYIAWNYSYYAGPYSLNNAVGKPNCLCKLLAFIMP